MEVGGGHVESRGVYGECSGVGRHTDLAPHFACLQLEYLDEALVAEEENVVFGGMEVEAHELPLDGEEVDGQGGEEIVLADELVLSHRVGAIDGKGEEVLILLGDVESVEVGLGFEQVLIVLNRIELALE